MADRFATIRGCLRNRWVRRAGFALLLAAVYFGVRAWQQQDLASGVAPTEAGVGLEGEIIAIADSNAPTLVYFWASWCAICEVEAGSIADIARDHRVVTIAMQSGTDAEVERYLHGKGLKLPVINDPDGLLAKRWGVRVTPTFFILGRDGGIRFRETGYTSGVGLRARLWLAN